MKQIRIEEKEVEWLIGYKRKPVASVKDEAIVMECAFVIWH